MDIDLNLFPSFNYLNVGIQCLWKKTHKALGNYVSNLAYTYFNHFYQIKDTWYLRVKNSEIDFNLFSSFNYLNVGIQCLWKKTRKALGNYVSNLAYTYFLTIFAKLKADRLHLCNEPHTPTDYRHTVDHLRLGMTPIALCWTWTTLREVRILVTRPYISVWK